MSDATQVADPPLELAAALRKAIALRSDSMRQILAEYDVAESTEARWETAASLMFAIERIDAEYAKAKEAAVSRFRRRQREAGHGA